MQRIEIKKKKIMCEKWRYCSLQKEICGRHALYPSPRLRFQDWEIGNASNTLRRTHTSTALTFALSKSLTHLCEVESGPGHGWSSSPYMWVGGHQSARLVCHCRIPFLLVLRFWSCPHTVRDGHLRLWRSDANKFPCFVCKYLPRGQVEATYSLHSRPVGNESYGKHDEIFERCVALFIRPELSSQISELNRWSSDTRSSDSKTVWFESCDIESSQPDRFRVTFPLMYHGEQANSESSLFDGPPCKIEIRGHGTAREWWTGRNNPVILCYESDWIDRSPRHHL